MLKTSFLLLFEIIEMEATLREQARTTEEQAAYQRCSAAFSPGYLGTCSVEVLQARRLKYPLIPEVRKLT